MMSGSARPDFAAQVIEDVLALFPLNEAIMEQAEALEPHAAALLRERRAGSYPQITLPPIETIVERIRARGFALADSLIRAYHVALQTKPLVILPGISGTGKTRLTRLYADAIFGDTLGGRTSTICWWRCSPIGTTPATCWATTTP